MDVKPGDQQFVVWLAEEGDVMSQGQEYMVEGRDVISNTK